MSRYDEDDKVINIDFGKTNTRIVAIDDIIM